MAAPVLAVLALLAGSTRAELLPYVDCGVGLSRQMGLVGRVAGGLSRPLGPVLEWDIGIAGTCASIGVQLRGEGFVDEPISGDLQATYMYAWGAAVRSREDQWFCAGDGNYVGLRVTLQAMYVWGRFGLLVPLGPGPGDLFEEVQFGFTWGN